MRDTITYSFFLVLVYLVVTIYHQTKGSMAGKLIPMSHIKQLLRLYQQGAGKKTIARTLDMSRNTVKAYLDTITELDESIDDLLNLDDPVLSRRLHAGSPAYKDARYSYLAEQLDYFTRELTRVGVTRKLLWEEYRSTQSDGYSYSQFCYHLSRLLATRRPSMVLTHCPADKLFIDYAGKTLSITDPDTGEISECQVFIACLPYSDYSFAMAVKTQTIPDFIHALVCCLKALGGVPKALVPDNLKSAIVKAHRYEPDVNRALEDLANHYHTTVVPARAGKPKDKALVENQVKLIYNRVYAKLRNQVFFDLGSLNRAIAEKVAEHNQTRMQQKPYCRTERFVAEEKPLLSPLPDTDFELKYYARYKVAQNNHIYLGADKHYYSVPYVHIGKTVQVIYTRSLVRMYWEGTLIASHPRDPRQGRYTTTAEHLCSQHQHYLKRSPEYYLRRAGKVSATLRELFDRIFARDRYPEQLYRTCDGLLSLARKTDPEAFSRACRIALEHQQYSWQFIDNLLKNNMTNQAEPDNSNQLPKHDNVRGKEYYQQTLNLY